MVTVLVTGAGGVGGTATVQSLRTTTSHDIVAVDMDSSAPGLFLADEAAVVPAATDADWLAEMADVIERFDVDVVVPLVDEELPHMPRLQERVDVGVILPTPEVVELAIDKYALSQALAVCDVPVPQTILASDWTELSPAAFPRLIKPRRGRGSTGVTVLESVADCEQYLAETEYAPEELLLQQYITGTEYTTSVVVTDANQLLGIVPKEVIEKEGNTVRGVTRDIPVIAEACHAVYDAVEPHGPLNVQQIIDDRTNEPYVIEINPRFSSTACLTVEAGVDELDLLVRDAAGHAVTAPDGFREDVHLLRYTDHLFLEDGQFPSD